MLPPRLVPAFLLAAAVLAASLPALADGDPEALYQSAVADLKAGRYADACPKFAEARRLLPGSAPALQGLATCLDKAGKTASAWLRYRELSVELKTRGDSARAQAASDRAEELSKTLSRLRIKPESPDTAGLVIRLDREEVPRGLFGTGMNVDPGPHVLEATAPGYEVWQTTFTIGQQNDLRDVSVPSLTPKPAAQAPAAPAEAAPFWGTQRIAGVAVAGAGVAGLAVGAALGVLTLQKISDAKTPGNCNTTLTECTSSGMAILASGKGLAHGSTTGFVVGGAALAAGIVVFATAPSGGPAAAQKTGVWMKLGPVAGAEMTGVLVRGGW